MSEMVDVAREMAQARQTAITRSLLSLGADLYECRDVQQALESILFEARRFAGAEAGSLYLIEGDRLRFTVVQNDQLSTSEISRHLLDQELPIDSTSLAGFVALTRQIVSVPDCRDHSEELPFRVNRDLDAATGYDVRSILAIALRCPDGGCVGVMELFNRIGPAGEPVPFPNEIHQSLILLATQAAITLHNIQLQQQLREVHLHSIFRLSAIAEYRDADTGDHIRRVSRVSELLANRLGLSDDQIELIKYASPMHDVGKVAIPDAILLKPGNLTDEQWRIMQRHTVVGAEIFGEPEDEVLATAKQVALSHHERWDGHGYPRCLKADKIPLCGRITALADVFDAVVSRRCYKEACSLDVALDILEKDRGTHFDPDAVDAFIDSLDLLLESYPNLKAASV